MAAQSRLTANTAALAVLARQPTEVIEAVARALAEVDATVVLDERLWGPTPSRRDTARLGAQTAGTDLVIRRRLVTRALSVAQAAQRLSMSVQRVLQLIAEGHLLALKEGRHWRLPAWQFDARTTKGYLPALRELSRLVSGGVLSLSEWIARPCADLGGITPRAALAAGQTREVLRAASALTAAGW